MKHLQLGPDGDLAVNGLGFAFVEDGPAAVQRFLILLTSFHGEWFLDLDYGIPWFQSILGVKPISLAHVEIILREKILADPEAVAIDALAMELARASRQLNVTGDIETIFGSQTLGGTFP